MTSDRQVPPRWFSTLGPGAFGRVVPPCRQGCGGFMLCASFRLTMTALDLAIVEQRQKSPRLTTPFQAFLKTTGLAVVLVIGAHVLWSGMSEGYCIVWPGIGTRFTSDFSHRSFARIEPGMTAAQVETLIGPPMGIGRNGCSPSGWPAYRAGDV